MCTSHLKWRDDPAYLLEENDKPSAVGREAALVLCSEKKQLMNHKILPSLGAVPFFFAKSVTRVKTKKTKKKKAKKNISACRVAIWDFFLYLYWLTQTRSFPFCISQTPHGSSRPIKWSVLEWSSKQLRRDITRKQKFKVTWKHD